MKLRRVRHMLWSLVVGLGTVIYLIEEWLWETLQGLMRWLGKAPVLRQLEALISRLPPAGAAVVFLLPTSLALPVKLMALHQILQGHLLRGTLIVLAAKLLATALFARIYVLTEPALLQVPWFVRFKGIFVRWRDWAYAQLRQHPVWLRLHQAVQQWRERRRSWRLAKRLALLRWLRRQRGQAPTDQP